MICPAQTSLPMPSGAISSHPATGTPSPRRCRKANRRSSSTCLAEAALLSDSDVRVTRALLSLPSDDVESPSPDIYQEDGPDLGPRCLLEALHMDSLSTCDAAKLDCHEAIATFNQGLIHHRRLEYEEAAAVYECVLNYVFELLRTFAPQELPSVPLLTLAMHAHTNLGAIAYTNMNDREARAHFDAALLFAKQLVLFGKRHYESVANVLSNWCRIHWMRGDVAPDSLFVSMYEVLLLREQVLPWYHVDVASAHFNLAAAHHAQRQGDKAVTHLTKYLDIAAHQIRSQQRHKIDQIPALIYVLLIRYEEKEDSVSQELTRGLRTLQDKRQEGNNSAEVASVLNFIGTLLFHCQDYDNALLFFQEELSIEENLDERDRVSLSVTCNNIGRTLQEAGKLKEAIAFYKRALSADFRDSNGFKMFLKETRHSRDPTMTNLFSTVWYNLGLIHDKLGASIEAIRAFQISLNLRKLILGPTHPDIACLWYNIGVLQMERELLNDAYGSFQQALAIRARCTDHQLNDQRVMHTLQKLSTLQKSAGNLRGAIASLEQIGALVQQSTTLHTVNRHKELSHVYYLLSELYHALDEMLPCFVMAQAAVQAVEVVTCTLLEYADEEVPMSVKLATVEQWALSHLFMGSLLHEQGESIKANERLRCVLMTMNVFSNHPVFSSHNLALRQVIELLATSHCAPVA